MKVCVKCRKEMTCTQNGVAIHFGHGHVYPGDEYTCPVCGNQVVFSDGRSVHVDDITIWEHILQMDLK